jgi:hypothetical protein
MIKMSSIFTLENVTDFSEKLNIDELYERKKQYDLNKVDLYNKILNRIHVRIKTTARQKIDEQFCWYVVPEVILGIPKYDQGACIAYIMDKLKDNGFIVRYIHPNTLFICWKNWVPSYVRTELKKKTGIVIDEYGRPLGKDEDNGSSGKHSLEPKNLDEAMFSLNDPSSSSSQNSSKKKYTPINSYKPQGNLVYGEDLLSSLEDVFDR